MFVLYLNFCMITFLCVFSNSILRLQECQVNLALVLGIIFEKLKKPTLNLNA